MDPEITSRPLPPLKDARLCLAAAFCLAPIVPIVMYYRERIDALAAAVSSVIFETIGIAFGYYYLNDPDPEHQRHLFTAYNYWIKRRELVNNLHLLEKKMNHQLAGLSSWPINAPKKILRILRAKFYGALWSMEQTLDTNVYKQMLRKAALYRIWMHDPLHPKENLTRVKSAPDLTVASFAFELQRQRELIS